MPSIADLLMRLQREHGEHLLALVESPDSSLGERRIVIAQIARYLVESSETGRNVPSPLGYADTDRIPVL